MTQPEPHPDALQDWRAFKAITRGGRQAIENEAIKAYLDVFEQTGDLKKAEEANRNVYVKYYHNGNDNICRTKF